MAVALGNRPIPDPAGSGVGSAPDSLSYSMNPKNMPDGKKTPSQYMIELFKQEIIDHNPQLGQPEYRDNIPIFWEGLWTHLRKHREDLERMPLMYAQSLSDWMFEMFPIIEKEVGQIRAEIVRTKRDLPPISTMKTTPRNISFEIEHITGQTAFYHQGFEVDYYFMKKPEGMEVFDMLMQAVVYNMIALMKFITIRYFHTRTTFYTSPKQLYYKVRPPQSVFDALEDENQTFGGLNKRPEEYILQIARAKRIMGQEPGKEPGALIVTPGAVDFIQLHNRWRMDNSSVGGEAKGIRDRGEDARSLRGLPLKIIPQLDTTIHNRINSGLLTAIISRGSKFEFPDTSYDVRDEDYRHGMRDIWICGWDTNDWTRKNILDVIRHSPAFYPMKSALERDALAESPAAGRMNRQLMYQFIQKQDTTLTDTGQEVSNATRAMYDVNVIYHRARKGNQPYGYPQTAYGEWSQSQCHFGDMKKVAGTMHARLMNGVDASAMTRGAAVMKTLSNPAPALRAAVGNWLTNLANDQGVVAGTYDFTQRGAAARRQDYQSTGIAQVAPNSVGGVDFDTIPPELNNTPYGYGNVAGFLTIADVAVRAPGIIDPAIVETVNAYLNALRTFCANLNECTFEHVACWTAGVPMHNKSAAMDDETARLICAENWLFGAFKTPLVVLSDDAIPVQAQGGGSSSTQAPVSVPRVPVNLRDVNMGALRAIASQKGEIGKILKKSGTTDQDILNKITLPQNSPADGLLNASTALLDKNNPSVLGIVENAGADADDMSLGDYMAALRRARREQLANSADASVSRTVVTPFHLDDAAIAGTGTAGVAFNVEVNNPDSPIGYKFNVTGVNVVNTSETSFGRADNTTFGGSLITALPLIHPSLPLVARMSTNARARLTAKNSGAARLAGTGGFPWRSSDNVANLGGVMKNYADKMASLQYKPRDEMHGRDGLLKKYQDALGGGRVPEAIIAQIINPYSGPYDSDREYPFEEQWTQSFKLGLTMGAAMRAVLLQCPSVQAAETYARNHIRIPYRGLALRNSEEQEMVSQIVTVGGPVGVIYFGGQERFVTFAGGDKHFRIGNEFRTGAFIKDNRNFFWLKHTLGGRAMGGKGTGWITDGGIDRSAHIYSGSRLGKHSMMPILQCYSPRDGEDAFSTPHVSFRGFHDQARFANRVVGTGADQDFSKNRPQAMYDGVALINFYLNAKYRPPQQTPERQNFDAQTQAERFNEECSQSSQLVFDSSSKDGKRLIASHHAWGPQLPGLLYREQSMKFVDKTIPVSIEA